MGALLTQAAVIRLVQTENGSNGTGRTALRHDFIKASLQYEKHEGREHVCGMIILAVAFAACGQMSKVKMGPAIL